VRVWIDIDNPPQAQYMLPFRGAFEQRGAEVVVTARDFGITRDLLEEDGREFRLVGAEFGKQKWRKVVGVLGRARALAAFCRESGRPDLLVSTSRSAALAAWRLRIPAYVVVDYEHVELGIFRRSGADLLFPDVIDPAIFRQKGFPESRLLPFRGLKEDLSFAGSIEPAAAEDIFEKVDGGRLVRVVLRPPAETSHYYSAGSTGITRALLGYLAGRKEVLVIYAPRHLPQREYLDGLDWHNEPVVLEHAVPFRDLLESADLVVSSGGTMLREAAYLGIPAYSTFRSEIGAVDRHLENVGRLKLISSPADFEGISLRKRNGREPLASNSGLLDELTDAILERTGRRGVNGASRA